MAVCRVCGKDRELELPECCDSCFSAYFWKCYTKDRDLQNEQNVVIFNNQHYTIGPEHTTGFRGFSGAKVVITFKDGRVVTTTNLWHQGTIPTEFLDLYPENTESMKWRN